MCYNIARIKHDIGALLQLTKFMNPRPQKIAFQVTIYVCVW